MLGLAGLAFTACSNDDQVAPESNDGGRVRITLSLGRTQATRSLDPQTAAGLYNDIKSLEVAFYDGSGNRVSPPETVEGIDPSVYKLSATIETAKNALAQAVADGSSSVTTTMEIKEVPATATRVVIIANDNDEIPISLDKGYKNVGYSVIALRTQVKTDVTSIKRFSGEESLLTGEGTIMNDNTVSVSLRPVPSRIELKDITAVSEDDQSWGGSEIVSFTVEGFYINRFWRSGYLAPELTDQRTDATFVDYENISSDYSFSKYTENQISYMCSEPAEGEITYTSGDVSSGFIYKAVPQDNANRWGFMCLQTRNYGDATGDNVDEPVHVVVKLKVKYEEDDTEYTKFLTITKYTYSSDFSENGSVIGNQGSTVKQFLRGHVYQVNNVEFKVSDLTDQPYETTKNITAKVTVLPWVGVEVTPGFN